MATNGAHCGFQPLTHYTVDDKDVRNFVLSDGPVDYFWDLVTFIRQQSFSLDSLVAEAEKYGPPALFLPARHLMHLAASETSAWHRLPFLRLPLWPFGPCRSLHSYHYPVRPVPGLDFARFTAPKVILECPNRKSIVGAARMFIQIALTKAGSILDSLPDPAESPIGICTEILCHLFAEATPARLAWRARSPKWAICFTTATTS